MSWPRSIAPERAWKPMSIVPPSPPIATDLMRRSAIFPLRRSAVRPASTPDPTAAELGKATWIQGRFQAVVG